MSVGHEGKSAQCQRRVFGGQLSIDGAACRRSPSPASDGRDRVGMVRAASSRSCSPGDIKPRNCIRHNSLTRLPDAPANEVLSIISSNKPPPLWQVVGPPSGKRRVSASPAPLAKPVVSMPFADACTSMSPSASPRSGAAPRPPKIPIPDVNSRGQFERLAASPCDAGYLQTATASAAAAPSAACASSAAASTATSPAIDFTDIAVDATTSTVAVSAHSDTCSAASAVAECPLKATVAELRIGCSQKRWFKDRADRKEIASLLRESNMTPRLLEEVSSAAGLCHSDRVRESPTPTAYDVRPEHPSEVFAAASSIRERLLQSMPAKALDARMDWSRLVAVESLDVFRAQEVQPQNEGRQPKAVCVDINSGGSVFFGVLAPVEDGAADEAIVFKFCPSRHLLQSEQMAAELSWHLEIPAPTSRVLLKAHDESEWQHLAESVQSLCGEMSELLERKQSMLAMQFIRGASMELETDAWRAERLQYSAHAIGRLLVLDVLLGNADRLPIKSLTWRGNPSNMIWTSPGLDSVSSATCVPIDATIARRPPKMLVHETDQKAHRLLELVLLDRTTAQEVLLEVVSCNDVAVHAVTSDWLPSESAWVAKQSQELATSDIDKGVLPQSAVKAFHDGVRSALGLASRELGLLEMVADVLESWLDSFHNDMIDVSKARKHQSKTCQLQNWSKEAHTNDVVKERLASWQNLLMEKSLMLRQAVDDWAARRGVKTAFSFRGFIGDSVLNPIVDAYELLVRLKQLISRAKVMATASIVTRPCDLSPSPLLVGPVTGCCYHLLRKLGVTLIVNCTRDFLTSAEDLAGLQVHRLAVEDREDQNLLEHLENGLEAIDKAVADGGRVFVHCFEGKSRSVSVCLAYMMTRERQTLKDALAFIKSKRPQIRPNVGFLKQLMTVELETFGCASLTADDLPKGKPVLSSASRRRP